MIINKKKGFMLADTMLAVMIVGITITTMLVFFSELLSTSKSEQLAAMKINNLHSKLMIFDPESLSGVDIDLDIIPAFDYFEYEANEIKKALSGELPKFTIEKGLEVSFFEMSSGNNQSTAKGFSCPKLLRFDIGFAKISSTGDASEYNDKARVITSLGDAVTFCNSLSINSKNHKVFWLRDN